MSSFNKLANLHNMFFKRAEGALPKQFQGLEGFPLPGRPKVGPGHPLYRPAPGPGGALKGMPSPSKPPEAFPTKSSVTPGPNDVDPRYTPGMSAHGKYMDDIASMTPEGREHKLRQSIQNNGNTRSIYDTFKGFDQGVGLHAPVGSPAGMPSPSKPIGNYRPDPNPNRPDYVDPKLSTPPDLSNPNIRVAPNGR